MASVLLPGAGIIVRLGQDVAYVDFAPVVVKDGNQTKLVSPDVEDRELADLVRMGIERAHVRKTLPRSTSGHPVPGLQGTPRVCVHGPELAQQLLRDDVHATPWFRPRLLSASRFGKQDLLSPVQQPE